MSNLSPSGDSEVYRRIIESRLSDVWTAIPGTVKTYYPASSPTADITLMIRRPLPTQDEDVITEDLPVLPNVPVLFPSGGGFSITWPLSPGDSVQVIVQTLAFMQWRESGEVSDPGDLRLHHLGNTVCIPGSMGLNAGPIDSAQAADSALVIHGTTIKLHKDAANFVALANLCDTEFNKIHATLATGAVSAAPGTVTFGTPYSPSSVAATAVKAK